MLGERLRDLRKQKGYSQTQMARKLHITQGAISQWENGLTTPAADQLVTLAQVFGISVDELLGADAPIIRETQGVGLQAPRTTEARILAAGIDKMPEKERKKALEIMNLMFDKYADFFEKGNEADDT